MLEFGLFDKTQSFTTKKYNKLFYQLVTNKGKATIAVVTEKGIQVDTDSRYYESPHREILSYIESIKKNQAEEFIYTEDLDAGSIDTNKHQLLIDLLLQSNSIVDKEMLPICASATKCKISINIENTEDNKLNPILYIDSKKTQKNEIIFLTSRHLYNIESKTIFKCNDIAGDIEHLHPFLIKFLPSFSTYYLSLISSYFSEIPLVFKDYKFIKAGNKKAKPALFFEKVDSEQSLHIRFSFVLDGFESSFLDRLSLTKACLIDDDTGSVSVYNILYEDLSFHITKIQKKLDSFLRKNRLEVGYVVDEMRIVIPKPLAILFIEHSIYDLIEKYSIFGMEKLSPYKIKEVKPKLNLSFTPGSGIDFLEGSALVTVEGQEVSIATLLDQYSDNNYVALSDGSKGIIDKDYINKLSRLFKSKSEEKKISFFDLPLISDLIEEKITDEIFKKSWDVFEGFNELRNKSLTKLPIKAKLRDYQKEGVKWLKYLYKNKLGGCLADDMGLGKTIQTIALLSTIYPRQKTPSLILLPKTLLFNWQSELDKFLPTCSYYTYYGKNDDLGEAMKHSVILSTYGRCRNRIEKLKEERFHYIILDESQAIKNIQSNISKAVMLLKGDYRLALSGTPIENNLLELYSLFRFLNPSMFRSAQEFQSLYINPIQKEKDELAAKELRLKIYPFILRRLKRDVLTELPEKTEKVMWTDMSPEQKELYEQRRSYYKKTIKKNISDQGIGKSQMMIFQALTELRQIASVPESKSVQDIRTPKRDLLLEEVSDAIANDHKILIFVNFLQATESISQDLLANNIGHVVMTGATQNRKELVESFQYDSSIKVFISTLKTGSLGLNLVAADMVFIYDPWWNNSVESQAIDRAYRMGQRKTVMCYRFITKDSIEEKILKLQDMKTSMINQLIQADQSNFKSLSENDIEFLLGE